MALPALAAAAKCSLTVKALPFTSAAHVKFSQKKRTKRTNKKKKQAERQKYQKERKWHDLHENMSDRERKRVKDREGESE